LLPSSELRLGYSEEGQGLSSSSAEGYWCSSVRIFRSFETAEKRRGGISRGFRQIFFGRTILRETASRPPKIHQPTDRATSSYNDWRQCDRRVFTAWEI